VGVVGGGGGGGGGVWYATCLFLYLLASGAAFCSCVFALRKDCGGAGGGGGGWGVWGVEITGT